MHEEQHEHTEETIQTEQAAEERTTGDAATEEVSRLKAENEELKDKYLRLFAEFENFRKRSVRERLDLTKTAAQETLSVLLPVLDDFDRAHKIAADTATEETFSEGVTLVYNKLNQVLRQTGLRKMDSNGESFDPEFHEAVTEIPAPAEELKGKVLDTIEPGYFLHDKIIRYAKVVVGK